MSRANTIAAHAGLLLAAALFAASCGESVGPQRLRPPELATAVGAGIVLDQFTGVLGETGDTIGQGFNPTNPRRGDAIVATFFWAGSTNTITKVRDHLSDADQTPVGNTYTLVEYVTVGGISMATFVATNVQGFPDPNPDPQTVLNVDAIFSAPVTHAGVMLSAWTGIAGVSADALGAHRSASGTSTTTAVADPGTIPIDAGALAYAVTMSDNILVGHEPPVGFTNLAVQSDDLVVDETDYAVQASAGSVDPQWTWYFDSPSSPSNWLGTVLALNPAATQLAFTVQPRTTLPLVPIQPAVQVTVLDAQGNRITNYTGTVTIAIGSNGSLNPLMPGTLSGTKTV